MAHGTDTTTDNAKLQPLGKKIMNTFNSYIHYAVCEVTKSGHGKSSRTIKDMTNDVYKCHSQRHHPTPHA